MQNTDTTIKFECVSKINSSNADCASITSATNCGSATGTDTTIATDGICYWNGKSCGLIT